MHKVGGVHHSNCDTDDELLSAYLYLYLYLMSCECILRRVVSVDLCWGIRVSLWVRGASQQLRSPQPYPQPSTTLPTPTHNPIAPSTLQPLPTMNGSKSYSQTYPFFTNHVINHSYVFVFVFKVNPAITYMEQATTLSTILQSITTLLTHNSFGRFCFEGIQSCPARLTNI